MDCASASSQIFVSVDTRQLVRAVGTKYYLSTTIVKFLPLYYHSRCTYHSRRRYQGCNSKGPNPVQACPDRLQVIARGGEGPAIFGHARLKRKLDITILELSSSSHCVIVAAIAGRCLFYAFFFSPNGPVAPPLLAPLVPCPQLLHVPGPWGKEEKDNLESKRRKTHTPTIRTVGRLVYGYWLHLLYCTLSVPV